MPCTTPEPEVADLLDRAAARLEKPGAWIQGELAKDATGRIVTPEASAAVCWCAAGALQADDRGAVYAQAHRAMTRRLSISTITGWNDLPSRTQSEVVAELRAAAADLRAA